MVLRMVPIVNFAAQTNFCFSEGSLDEGPVLFVTIPALSSTTEVGHNRQFRLGSAEPSMHQSQYHRLAIILR